MNEQILPEIFDRWLKYQGAINKKNRINGVLKLELEKKGLANDHDDTNLTMTGLRNY